MTARLSLAGPSVASATWTLGCVLHLLLVGEPAPRAAAAARCEGGLWQHVSESGRLAAEDAGVHTYPLVFTPT